MNQNIIANWLSLTNQMTFSVLVTKVVFISLIVWLMVSLIRIYKRNVGYYFLKVMDLYALKRWFRVIGCGTNLFMHMIYLFAVVYALLYVVNAIIGVSVKVFAGEPINLAIGVSLSLGICGYQIYSSLKNRRLINTRLGNEDTGDLR